MLSAEQICTDMEMDRTKPDHLSIVPRPDTAAIRKRGGTSIDLRLGRWFRSFKPSKHAEAKLWHQGDRQDPDPDGIRTNEHFVRFGSNFVLHPGRFVLGVTMEWLTLPKTLSGYVTGKSSLGRHGLVIETAAGLHPGFSGCLTLELANVGEVPVAISPGMEICQIFLHRIDPVDIAASAIVPVDGGTVGNDGSVNGKLAPGTFSGQRKPALALPRHDAVFERLRGKNRD